MDKQLIHTLAFFTLLPISTTFAGDLQYTATALPMVQSTSITNSGLVIGEVGTLWNQNAGAVPITTPGYFWSDSGINNTGTIAGTVLNTDGTSPYNSASLFGAAATWINGQTSILPPLISNSFSFASAMAINNSGVVVGISGSNSDPHQFQAVRWTNGAIQDLSQYLDPIVQSSAAMAINNVGQVVLVTNPNSTSIQSFLLSGTQLTAITVSNPSVQSVQATAINNSGIIAGSVYLTDGTSRAFRWANGQMEIAPFVFGPGSMAGLGVNNAGWVVGYFSSSDQVDDKAFLWNGTDDPMSLQELLTADSNNWNFFAATSINDQGQIVGNGSYNGEPSAFLLSPVGSNPSIVATIPEPTTATLLLLAAPLLLRRNRRQH